MPSEAAFATALLYASSLDEPLPTLINGHGPALVDPLHLIATVWLASVIVVMP
jgi:hypothetical protein